MRSSDWSSEVCSSDLAREGQPFGVDVQLHLVTARDDWGDDVADNRRTVDERRHRVDEEDALQAIAFEHIHLEMDAEIAVAAPAEDRPTEIAQRVRAPPLEAGHQLVVEADAGHLTQAPDTNMGTRGCHRRAGTLLLD